LFKGFELDWMHEELETNLRKELDFENEARVLHHFALHLSLCFLFDHFAIIRVTYMLCVCVCVELGALRPQFPTRSPYSRAPSVLG